MPMITLLKFFSEIVSMLLLVLFTHLSWNAGNTILIEEELLLKLICIISDYNLIT